MCSKGPTSLELPPIPSPPHQDDKPDAWARWLIHFLDWFIDAWSRYESAFVWIDDEDPLTPDPPTPLKDQAPELLDTAACVPARFFRSWKFPHDKRADAAARCFREAVDLIRNADYAALNLSEFEEHRRNFKDGLAHFGASDASRANKLDGGSREPTDGGPRTARQPPVRHSTEAGDSNDLGFYSVASLSQMFDVDHEALRKRLERFRRKHPDDGTYMESADPKQGEPHFLYKLDAVRPTINNLKAADGTSAKRPAKKT